MYSFICPNCNCRFSSPDKDRKYCCRSCSSTAVNKLFPRKQNFPFKRPTKEKILCLCGNKKSTKASKCQECNSIHKLSKYEAKTLKEVRIEVAQSAFVKIRQHAKRKFKNLKIKKECKICGYTNYIELAHIKPIHTFTDLNTIGEINHIDNLIYLCPNHHKELDSGLITLPLEFL